MQFKVLNKQVPQPNSKPAQNVKDIAEVPTATVRDAIVNHVSESAQDIPRVEHDSGNGKAPQVQFKQETFTKGEVLKLLKANNEMEMKNRIVMVRDILNQIIENGGNEITK